MKVSVRAFCTKAALPGSACGESTENSTMEAAVVGPEIAQHVTPESFEDGVLVVRADSTSWATNLRYMAPLLLERLAAEVGEGVVGDLRVLGPAAPSWRRGRRSAPGGRGPRDTYG